MTQFATFYVPIRDDGQMVEELNAFLRSHRVLHVEKQVEDGGWIFCVEWMAGGGDGHETSGGWRRERAKVDYREVLTVEEFAVFSKLRAKRKELAERDAVQVYTVMSNEQLAAMAKGKAQSLVDLQKIDGIGEERLKRYGEAFLEVLNGEEVANV